MDPSDLFTTLKPRLLDHLPLRNLHWKSSNRPLRSIDTLHVDLIRDGHDSTSGSERRHQIPGLRETPYVKIYLLRCDDNEAYKATCRKQIRDWIKSSGQPGESKKGLSNSENHDAWEWLIVHVIVPDTPAAAQVRASKDAQLGATDSSESIANKSKWTGKGSAPVLEKLRADFNSSSKSSIDRVAQVRISNAEEQAPEAAEEEFGDLIEKLKVSILTSFDLRVRQYEEDIREKDGQRNLPGWNFNTFFILKEGLARGFENVGLLDDALVGYDELALGLEVIVQEQLEGERANDHGGRFVPFSDELKSKIQACLKDADEGSGTNAHHIFDANIDPSLRLQRRDYPLDASRRPFRDLILANDISILDFRLYIFSRQLELLLRSANALSVADQPSMSQSCLSEQEEYFLPLAEACQRAIGFITSTARNLRHDLELALDMDEPMSPAERKFRGFVITNFVLSWEYTSSMQLLVQTRSLNLILPDPPPEQTPSDMRAQSSSRSPSPVKLNASEPSPWSETTFGRPTSQDILSPNLYAFRKPHSSTRPDLQHKQSGRSNNTKTGGEELASGRAELYLLARAAVEQIGIQHDWSLRWDFKSSKKAVSMGQFDEVQEVPLDSDHQQNGIADNEPVEPVINGLQYPDLRNVFHSLLSIKNLYGCLTTHVYRHFLAANRLKSAGKAIADIALLKYEAGDFEAATSYLSRIASFQGDSHWNTLEGAVLELYADCLKKLGRHGEYVSNLLKFLGQKPTRRQTMQSPPAASTAIEGYLADLWSLSKQLTSSFHARLSDFFSIKKLASDIHHFRDEDGFFIPLEITFRLGSSIELTQGLEMSLSSISESFVPTIEMATRHPLTVGSSPTRVSLESNLSVSGWYKIERLQIVIGNITFLEDYNSLRRSNALDDQSRIDPYAFLRFFIYPPQHSLKATASPAPYLHLSQTRSILLVMETGWNEIQKCSLSMKSGTAGLRLRLNEAKVDTGDESERLLSVGDGNGTQAIELTNCRVESSYRFLVPYTLENADIPVIYAKLDIEYSTATGDFIYSSSISVNTILSISVNVQDIFREGTLLSRFTVSPATLVPLRLWSCDLHHSDDNYTIESNVGVQGAMDVFPRQPASFIYKFVDPQSASLMKDRTSLLAVSLKFSCLDEVVLEAIETCFEAFITRSPIAGLIQPLCAHLLTTFRSQWTAQDLEVIGLCHEIDIWPFNDFGWDTVLVGLHIETRNLARTWLKKWHNENVVIPIYADLENSNNVPSRLITIPVDLPTPPVVATASLELDSRRTEPVIMSEALIATLQIAHTRSWAATLPSRPNDHLQIFFEVVAPAENWVIGGMRKGSFLTTAISRTTAITQPKEAVHSVPIILLPQRIGHLLLPSVEVQCHEVAEQPEDDVVPRMGSRVPCEVDIKSASRSVHVISGLRETVVEIVVDETQGLTSEKRNWLVASKDREGSLITLSS